MSEAERIAGPERDVRDLNKADAREATQEACDDVHTGLTGHAALWHRLNVQADEIAAALAVAEELAAVVKTYPGGRGLGANRTPQPAAEYVAIDTMDPEVRNALDEQDGVIEELRNIIDQLHAANKHLAGRFDKLERELKELREAATKDITGLHSKTSDMLDILDTVTMLGKDMGRDLDSLLAHHPQCQKPTIQQQCDAVTFRGQTEEGD